MFLSMRSTLRSKKRDLEVHLGGTFDRPFPVSTLPTSVSQGGSHLGGFHFLKAFSMSSEAPAAAPEVVGEPNASNGVTGESTAKSAASAPPPATVTDPSPSGVTEEKPKAEVPLSERLKVSLDLPVSAPTSKKERPKLTLAPWQPDDGVSECHHCKRSFNPLLLRFKVCTCAFCWIGDPHALRRLAWLFSAPFEGFYDAHWTEKSLTRSHLSLYCLASLSNLR